MYHYSSVGVAWSCATKYDLAIIGILEVCTLSSVNLANHRFEHFVMSYV
jgi:hypothetical protein